MESSSMTKPLTEVLRAFEPASASLQARRSLLRRSDAKFLVSASEVAAMLGHLRGDYAVLPVAGSSIATYQNLYFDTPALRSYHDHLRGRRIRQKVRIRHYPERQVAYLEVKSRRNELLTDKHRLAVPYGTTALDEPAFAFLSGHCTYTAKLGPSLEIDYQRISLIGISAEERVTLDYQVVARDPRGKRLELEDLAIIEVKQPSLDLGSPVMQVVRSQGLKQCAFSKYAVATALTGDVPCNRFKPALRALERISP
jgi:VTC domain